MSESPRRPRFRTQKQETVPSSPAELFYKLGQPEKTHEYPRGPQQDALRDYLALDPSVTDVAVELPTGTGKTAAGLLIAEWHRRKGRGRAAYLALTNQLAKQVLAEAARLGLQCANLIGTKYTRDSAEEGKCRAGEAVAVTSYSNLFNVNPVIQQSEVLLLDDAHGGEHYVCDNWTVRVTRSEEPALFESESRSSTTSG